MHHHSGDMDIVDTTKSMEYRHDDIETDSEGRKAQEEGNVAVRSGRHGEVCVELHERPVP